MKVYTLISSKTDNGNCHETWEFLRYAYNPELIIVKIFGNKLSNGIIYFRGLLYMPFEFIKDK